MGELWELLLSAQASENGIPESFTQQKKEEIKKRMVPMLQNLEKCTSCVISMLHHYSSFFALVIIMISTYIYEML